MNAPAADVGTASPRLPALRPSPRAWLWLGGFAVWTLLGLLSASQRVLYRLHSGEPAPWSMVFGRTLADWYTCALFTPAIVWLAGRFPLDRGRWARSLPVHVLASAAFVLLKLALFIPLAQALGWLQQVDFVDFALGDSFALLLTYWIVLSLAHGVAYYQRYHERQLRASQLESRLSRVQLEALRTQIHPHFLFNALNALSALMHRDVAAADRMVLQLSELLRQTLDNAAPQETTLRDELAFIERYLSIMRIRLGERLRVEYETEPETLDALVPNLVLQPLVENALRHGIGRRSDAGLLAIRAWREGGTLLLQVQDDGPGIPDGPVQEGVGLRNTRLRLEQLYGGGQSFDLDRAPGGGALVTVALPFHHQTVETVA